MPLSVVIKVVKLAYCYEQWDVYDALSEATVTAIRVGDRLTDHSLINS